MARTRTVFRCMSCGAESPKWSGRCAGCGDWNTLAEELDAPASLVGSKEIGFTIVSMTISLAAVFIPILFMSGILGRLFREFAVTICTAILISGVVSISLTPMLCSRFLKEIKPKKRGVFYRATEAMFNGMLNMASVAR